MRQTFVSLVLLVCRKFKYDLVPENLVTDSNVGLNFALSSQNFSLASVERLPEVAVVLDFRDLDDHFRFGPVRVQVEFQV